MILIHKHQGYCKAEYADGSKLIISYKNAEEMIKRNDAIWA